MATKHRHESEILTTAERLYIYLFFLAASSSLTTFSYLCIPLLVENRLQYTAVLYIQYNTSNLAWSMILPLNDFSHLHNPSLMNLHGHLVCKEMINVAEET
jgi:hypothetical protein